VVVHLPGLCEQKKIAYSYVPNKVDLGKSIGMNVPCTAVAVENAGTASNAIKDIISKVTGSTPSAAPQAKQEPKAEKEAKPKATPKKQQQAAKIEAAADDAKPEPETTEDAEEN
jgi:hypothetical protein